MRYRDNLERQEMTELLHKLRAEHAELDLEVTQISSQPVADQFYLGRMKRRKLRLKDMIVQLQSEILPDLPA